MFRVQDQLEKKNKEKKEKLLNKHKNKNPG